MEINAELNGASEKPRAPLPLQLFLTKLSYEIGTTSRAQILSCRKEFLTAQAKARGVSPGGDIMIHGLPNAIGFIGKLHTKRDWTLGCIAVTNPEIEAIWRVVPDRATVEIVR